MICWCHLTLHFLLAVPPPPLLYHQCSLLLHFHLLPPSSHPSYSFLPQYFPFILSCTYHSFFTFPPFLPPSSSYPGLPRLKDELSVWCVLEEVKLIERGSGWSYEYESWMLIAIWLMCIVSKSYSKCHNVAVISLKCTIPRRRRK